MALLRARTPAQVALWGVFETGRVFRRHRQRRSVGTAASRAAALSLEHDDLRTAAIVIAGYASEAALPNVTINAAHLGRESTEAAAAFIGTATAELDRSVHHLAARHTGWFTRARYELLLALMLVMLLYRMGKNFFGILGWRPNRSRFTDSISSWPRQFGGYSGASCFWGRSLADCARASKRKWPRWQKDAWRQLHRKESSPQSSGDAARFIRFETS